MVFIKIFEEGNDGPQDLEDRINDYLMEREGIQVKQMNSVIEHVDGIAYKSVIILSEYPK